MRYFFARWPDFSLQSPASPRVVGVTARLQSSDSESLRDPAARPRSSSSGSSARLERMLLARDRRDATQRLERNDSAPIVAIYPALVTAYWLRRGGRVEHVGELVEFVNDLVRPGEPTEPAEAFVGLRHIESHTGRRIGSLPLRRRKGRKFRFQPGDVVYRIPAPRTSTRSGCADMHGLCSVDQYVAASSTERCLRLLTSHTHFGAEPLWIRPSS